MIESMAVKSSLLMSSHPSYVDPIQGDPGFLGIPRHSSMILGGMLGERRQITCWFGPSISQPTPLHALTPPNTHQNKGRTENKRKKKQKRKKKRRSREAELRERERERERERKGKTMNRFSTKAWCIIWRSPGGGPNVSNTHTHKYITEQPTWKIIIIMKKKKIKRR